MMVFLTLVVIFISGLLIVTAAVRPRRSQISLFELERRSRQGDSQAKEALRREHLLPAVLTLQRRVIGMILIALTLVSLSAFGYAIGLAVASTAVLFYGSLAKTTPVAKLSQKLYRRFEPRLLRLAEKLSGTLRLLSNPSTPQAAPRLHSKDELNHLAEHAGGILTSDERLLIANGLIFSDHKVREIMTPRSRIDSIGRGELLGPLVLDDLHKTGHDRFPVIDGDLDHIVGMLYLKDLLTVDGGKHSTTAEKNMEARVFYIGENQSLQDALAAFLKTRHHLFVVVNELQETAGLISLEDVIGTLFGRDIDDGHSSHEDLRVVAGRN